MNLKIELKTVAKIAVIITAITGIIRLILDYWLVI